jgi:hypothetical protein
MHKKILTAPAKYTKPLALLVLMLLKLHLLVLMLKLHSVLVLLLKDACAFNRLFFKPLITSYRSGIFTLNYSGFLMSKKIIKNYMKKEIIVEVIFF